MRHSSAVSRKRAASDCDVSGRVLLLRSLRDGLPAARSNPAFAPADEPGKICTGEKNGEITETYFGVLLCFLHDQGKADYSVFLAEDSEKTMIYQRLLGLL